MGGVEWRDHFAASVAAAAAAVGQAGRRESRSVVAIDVVRILGFGS